MQESGHVISLEDVRFSWPRTRGFALRVKQFAVTRGESLLLLGPSGSGKSTLLSLLCGIISPQHGHIRVLDTDLTDLSSAKRDQFRAEHFGVIFQMFNLLPYGTVVDNITLPLNFAPGRRAAASKIHSSAAEALRLLSRLGIDTETKADAASANLSVGQQQRVAAARALIGNPEIIVADEPTSALDSNRRDDFLSLLFEEVARSDSTLLMVSHDESLAHHFDRCVDLAAIATTESEVAQ